MNHSGPLNRAFLTLLHSHLPSRTPDGLNIVARRGLARQIGAHARSAARSVVDLRDERASDVRVEVPARSSRSRYFNSFGVLGWPVPAASVPRLHYLQNAPHIVEPLVRQSASPPVRQSASPPVPQLTSSGFRFPVSGFRFPDSGLRTPNSELRTFGLSDFRTFGLPANAATGKPNLPTAPRRAAGS